MNNTNVFKNLSMILATTEGGLLGVGNKLPWNCKEDLKHFKKTTMGHTVVMGRNTWESLPFKNGLPGRKNVVISRTMEETEGVTIYRSVEAFLTMLDLNTTDETFFIIGGMEIYSQLSPHCLTVYHTVIPDELVTPNLEGKVIYYDIRQEDYTLVETIHLTEEIEDPLVVLNILNRK